MESAVVVGAPRKNMLAKCNKRVRKLNICLCVMMILKAEFFFLAELCNVPYLEIVVYILVFTIYNSLYSLLNCLLYVCILYIVPLGSVFILNLVLCCLLFHRFI